MRMDRLLSFILIGHLCTEAIGGDEILDGVAAVIGDKVILRSEWMQAAHGLALQAGMNPASQPEEFEKFRVEVLRNLINNKVLLIKAEEDTVKVEEQQITARLDDRIKEMIGQLGSKEKVEEYFGMSIQKIKKTNRDEIRDQLMIQQIQQEKMAKVQVSRRDVEQFYSSMKDSLPRRPTQVRLRHLLKEVKAGQNARAVAEDKIRRIQSRLAEGEDFGECAKMESEDPGTASKGGLLGWVEKGMLFESFDQAAFELQQDQISNVVETALGLHLIQMLKKEGNRANLRHILVRIGLSEQDEKKVFDEIKRLRERMISGEDFGALAKQFSDDKESKENGGDLQEWFAVETFQIPEFRVVADTLQPGEISQPFKTQFGFHLVKLEARRPGGVISLEEDWEQVKNYALQMKQQKAMTGWIEELKQSVYVRIADDINLTADRR